MLAIRPNCEHCGKNLTYNDKDAMICSFECTYCKVCALELFENVCPSCGGNFVPRPIRPTAMLDKYPASKERVYKPKDTALINKMSDRYKNIEPEKR